MGNNDLIPSIQEPLAIEPHVKSRKRWQKYSAIALLILAACMVPNFAFWCEVAKRTLGILEERFGTPLSVFIFVASFTWFTKRLHGAFHNGEPMPRLTDALRQVWEWAKTSVVTLLLFAVLFGLVAVFHVIPKMYSEMKSRAEARDRGLSDVTKREAEMLVNALDADVKRATAPSSMDSRYYKQIESVIPKLLGSGNNEALDRLSKYYENMGVASHSTYSNLAVHIRAALKSLE